MVAPCFPWHSFRLSSSSNFVCALLLDLTEAAKEKTQDDQDDEDEQGKDRHDPIAVWQQSTLKRNPVVSPFLMLIHAGVIIAVECGRTVDAMSIDEKARWPERPTLCKICTFKQHHLRFCLRNLFGRIV
jgi:hypothetical protein